MAATIGEAEIVRQVLQIYRQMEEWSIFQFYEILNIYWTEQEFLK